MSNLMRDDKLYRDLTIRYYLRLDTYMKKKVADSFALLWNGVSRGGTMAAGEALRLALIDNGIVVEEEEKGIMTGADEYEAILEARALYDEL